MQNDQIQLKLIDNDDQKRFKMVNSIDFWYFGSIVMFSFQFT